MIGRGKTYHNRSYGVLIRSLPTEVFNTSLGWDRNLLEELPALFENLGQRISKVSSDSRFCAPAIPSYSLVVWSIRKHS